MQDFYTLAKTTMHPTWKSVLHKYLSSDEWAMFADSVDRFYARRPDALPKREEILNPYKEPFIDPSAVIVTYRAPKASTLPTGFGFEQRGKRKKGGIIKALEKRYDWVYPGSLDSWKHQNVLFLNLELTEGLSDKRLAYETLAALSDRVKNVAYVFINHARAAAKYIDPDNNLVILYHLDLIHPTSSDNTVFDKVKEYLAEKRGLSVTFDWK